MSSSNDSSFERMRKTLDKHHSTIDTVGNIVNYFQNEKIAASQREMSNNLAVQNQLREEQLRQLNELIEANEKEAKKRENADKLKVVLLSIVPKLNELLETIDNDLNVRAETKALIVQHLLSTYKLMDENKEVVSDVSFYTFLHDFRKRISSLEQLNKIGSESIKIIKSVIKSFSKEIDEIIVINSVEKADLKEVYESGLYKELYKVKNHINHLTRSHENGKFSRYISNISTYIDALNEVQSYIPDYNYENNGLPLSVDEALSLKSIVEDIDTNFTDFIDNSNRRVDKINQLFGLEAKEDLDKINDLANKINKDIYIDDIDFIIEKSNVDIYIILRHRFKNVMEYYIEKINKLETMLDYIDASTTKYDGYSIIEVFVNNGKSVHSAKIKDKLIGQYLSMYVDILEPKVTAMTIIAGFVISLMLFIVLMSYKFVFGFISFVVFSLLYWTYGTNIIKKEREDMNKSISAVNDKVKVLLKEEHRRVEALKNFMNKTYKLD